MKKIYFSLLVLTVVFLSGCSVTTKQNSILEQQPAERQDSATRGQIEEQGKEQVTTDNIVYKNDDFNFEITMPLSWQDYQVQNRKISKELYGKKYIVSELDFGFPINLEYDQQNNTVNAKKCDSCFTNIFTLTVYNKIDFDEISKNNNTEIAKNGNTPFTDLGRLVASNSNYVFSVPGNIHGQSFDGQFVYDRQTEAGIFLGDSFNLLK
ncbi:MAG: hypothetical protein PHR98_03855 [Candidatus Shapirobacteria bacterium]|nr:hypothetical protein [Candidatus Shapirobacteria bacterium]